MPHAETHTPIQVLVVDDEAPMRRLLMRILSGRCYACHAVDNARAARRYLAATDVQLLITDIRMPGESGIDLLRAVARDHSRVARLLVTGVNDGEAIDAASSIGVDGYITKPFEKSQLLVGVDLALRHRALEVENQNYRLDLERRVAERTRELEQTVKDMEAARRDIQKTKSLFEGLFANAKVGIAICEPSPDGEDFYFVDFNPAAETLDGMSRQELIHRSVRDVFPDAERIGVLGWAHQVARTGRPEHHLVALEGKGGKAWRDYYLYRLPSGEVVTFYTDETERIQAERRLQQQFEFTQNLLESIPSPIFYKSIDGRYQGCNGAFAALMGRPQEDIVGLTTQEIAPQDLARNYIAVDRELFAHAAQKQIETQFQATDGTRHDIILSKRSYTDEDGRIAGVVGVLVDISERKRAEDFLKESEAEFRAIAESAQDAIIKIDGRGRITYWNRSAEAIFGYSAEEAAGQALHPLIAPSRYQTRILPALEHFRQTGQGPSIGRIIEVTARGKNGREFPAELSIASVCLDGSWHAIGIVRDITDRKQMEERLLQKHAKLKSIRADLEAQNLHLAQMHAELKQVQQQTVQQEKMASIGQLAAGVAHEINNPTGFVSSNLKSLQDYLEDIFRLLSAYEELRSLFEAAPNPAPADVAEQLAAIKRIESDIDLEFLMSDTVDLIRESREGTDRIKKIVIDLKDFAHPGQQERMTTDLNRNIESVLNIVWNELKYKATVHKNFGDLPPVECYPQQLNQVFMNLLVNAGQAMEAMGEIHITTRAERDHVVIEIGDTGCGIPEADLQRIFDPFFTTKPVGKGTGLGLNVAYNIVKKHGGELTATSRVGVGTTFNIRLPMELPEDASPVEEHHSEDAGERNVRQAS